MEPRETREKGKRKRKRHIQSKRRAKCDTCLGKKSSRMTAASDLVQLSVAQPVSVIQLTAYRLQLTGLPPSHFLVLSFVIFWNTLLWANGVKITAKTPTLPTPGG
jgi:hypothetical protein